MSISGKMKKRVMPVFFITLIMSLTSLASSADAKEIYVPKDFATIQDAISAAIHGDTIIVSPGTYKENIKIKQWDITLKSEYGPARTIIDGGGSGSVITFYSGIGAGTVVEGFTITNGRAPAGGGIYCESASPSILNCDIIKNSANSGGGIYCAQSSIPQISNCRIMHNSAEMNGGGVYCESSSPAITKSTIYANTAKFGAGVYCLYSSSPIIKDSEITYNMASIGAGVYCMGSSSPSITNCKIEGNSADWLGDWMFYFNSSPVVSNCNINGNLSDYGDGIISYFMHFKQTIKNDTSMMDTFAELAKCMMLFELFFIKLSIYFAYIKMTKTDIDALAESFEIYDVYKDVLLKALQARRN